MKLICIPYAGGTSLCYGKWRGRISEKIELCIIDMPGHGRRMKEPMCSSFEELVSDTKEQIMKIVNFGEDYAIIGHSMGSFVAYEVYYQLLNSNFTLPRHMFFSGSNCPGPYKLNDYKHLLPDDEFIDYVDSIYKGSTKKDLNKEEIKKVFLPVLRNDFRILELYEWEKKDAGIRCDITILNGRSDESIVYDAMENWKNITMEKVNFYLFNGDHFFLFNNRNFDNIFQVIYENIGQ